MTFRGASNSVTPAIANSSSSPAEAAPAAVPDLAPLEPSFPASLLTEPSPSVEGAACLSAVVEVQSELAAVGLDGETVMRVAAERARTLAGADGVAVALVDGDACAYRHASGTLASWAGRRLTADEGVLGYAMRTGEAHYCRDTEADVSGDSVAWREAGARSLIVVPLRHAGQSIGAMVVASSTPQAFRGPHVQALRVLGGILAAAMSHAGTLGANKSLLAERTAALSALRESAVRFRTAFEHASIGMAIVALDGRWIRVNRSLCELVCHGEAEILATDFQHLTHPEDLEADVASLRQLVSGEVRCFHLTKRYFHKQGHVVWALLSTSLVRDDHGRPLYFIEQIQDVTQRKQSEWLEDDRRDVLEMVARHQPLDLIVHRLCRMAERQIPGVRASVMLLQDGALRNVAPNLPPDFAENVRPKLLSLAAALCGRAEQQGRFASGDIANDPEWTNFRESAFAHGLRGCWAAPVRSSEGDFLGMVVLYLRHPSSPGPLAERLLDHAAKLTTVAIEHRELAQQLTYRAFHDPLTGLANRMLFDERLEHAMARARRNKTFVTLLAVDLDRFKAINDSLGHEAGDELLQQFSLRMAATLRETDTVARVGGDEFMIVLPDLNDASAAAVVARKLIEATRAPFHVAGRDLRVTASFGGCVYPKDAQDVLTLQRGADAALYRAKGTWARFALSGDMEDSASDTAALPAPASEAPQPGTSTDRELYVG